MRKKLLFPMKNDNPKITTLAACESIHVSSQACASDVVEQKSKCRCNRFKKNNSFTVCLL